MPGALAGQVAVVTGASRGIGGAVAVALAREGARVALVARDAARLESLARTLSGALAFAADLATPQEVERVAQAVRHTMGVPSIVVNNAGAFALGQLGALSLTEVERMVQVNLVAPYQLLHHLLPAMRTRGRGHVVMIGSIADHVAFPENAAYSASKYGARGIHEVLRAELRGSGVRATLISPGPVDTAMWDPVGIEHREGFVPRTDMLSAVDVADAVVWAVTRPSHVQVDELRLGSIGRRGGTSDG
jgi:NADP-dependent 3-hydroxy acid dehydrogenase YdfG